jgi:hypothetical protein
MDRERVLRLQRIETSSKRRRINERAEDETTSSRTKTAAKAGVQNSDAKRNGNYWTAEER